MQRQPCPEVSAPKDPAALLIDGNLGARKIPPIGGPARPSSTCTALAVWATVCFALLHPEPYGTEAPGMAQQTAAGPTDGIRWPSSPTWTFGPGLGRGE